MMIPHDAATSVRDALSDGLTGKPLRNLHTEARETQKSHGATPAPPVRTETLRPVVGAEAPGPAAALRRPDPDEQLTGPRPTFAQTPLEQMRNAAFQTASRRAQPAAPDAYGDLRCLDSPMHPAGILNVTT